MWEPRVMVEGWAWFAGAYLVGMAAAVAALVAPMVRLRVPRRLLRGGVAGVLAVSVGVFLWLLGSPVLFALMLGVGIVPASLIATGGYGPVPPGGRQAPDAE